MKLTPTKEELMNYIWKADKMFMRDMLEAYPPPKTSAGYCSYAAEKIAGERVLGYKLYGNSREYYPHLQKREYFSEKISTMVSSLQ